MRIRSGYAASPENPPVSARIATNFIGWLQPQTPTSWIVFKEDVQSFGLVFGSSNWPDETRWNQSGRCSIVVFGWM